MVRAILLTILAACMMGMTAQQSGCQGARTLTVQLVNDTGRDIDFTLAYSADADASFADLVDDGTEISDTVKAGEVVFKFLNCDATGAVALELAVLDVVAGVGPITIDDFVYRLDDHWTCGDTLQYRFTSSNNLTDLDVDSHVLP
jgi:hypothetical protein